MRSYDQARTGAVHRARPLRRTSTEAERLLWRALRHAFPRHRWRRHMPVGPYFADFASFADRLIVELDGGQPMASEHYDAVRTRFLRARGYRVLRFWNDEVLENIDRVLTQISLSLGRGKEGGAGGRTISPQEPTSSSRGFAAHSSPTGRGEGARP